jgi:hypothetical protein
LVLTCVGYVVKITRTVGNDIAEVKATAVAASGRADIAGINVAANTLKVERVATELAKHREDTAKEYVSYKHLVTLENRLVDAIANLGTRIDGMFTRMGATHA